MLRFITKISIQTRNVKESNVIYNNILNHGRIDRALIKALREQCSKSERPFVTAETITETKAKKIQTLKIHMPVCHHNTTEHRSRLSIPLICRHFGYT